MKKLTIVTVCLLGVSCGSNAPLDTTDPRTITEDEAIQIALESNSPPLDQGEAGYITEGELTAWREPGRKQTYTAENFNSVLVTDSVQDASGAWQSVTHQSSANFSVLHVASGGLDRYAVFGLTRDKSPVVELWNLAPAEASIVVQGSLDGYSYTQLDLVAKDFQKTRIFKGGPDSGAVAFEVDPAGRYVVCAIRDPQGEVSLLQIDAQTSAVPPTVLYDSTTIPKLSEVQYAQKADHALLGRVFVFGTAFDARKRIMLVDGDNDGVFDGAPLVGDDSFFSSQGLDRFEDWISLNH